MPIFEDAPPTTPGAPPKPPTTVKKTPPPGGESTWTKTSTGWYIAPWATPQDKVWADNHWIDPNKPAAESNWGAEYPTGQGEVPGGRGAWREENLNREQERNAQLSYQDQYNRRTRPGEVRAEMEFEQGQASQAKGEQDKLALQLSTPEGLAAYIKANVPQPGTVSAEAMNQAIRAQYDLLLGPVVTPGQLVTAARAGQYAAREQLLNELSAGGYESLLAPKSRWQLEHEVEIKPAPQMRRIGGPGRPGGLTEVTGPATKGRVPDPVAEYVNFWNEARSQSFGMLAAAVPQFAPIVAQADAWARDNPQLMYAAAVPPWVLGIRYWLPQAWQFVSKIPEMGFMLYEMTSPAPQRNMRRFWTTTYSPYTAAGGKTGTFGDAGAQTLITVPETDEAWRERVARDNAARMAFWDYVYDGTINEPNRKINYSRLFGTFQLAPDGLGGNVVLVPNTGITGLGVTFWLHPERLPQFTNDIETGMSFEQAVMKHEDLAAELIFNIATDVILWGGLPGGMSVIEQLAPSAWVKAVNTFFFPPAPLVEAGLAKLAPILAPMRLQAGEALITNIADHIDEAGWIERHFARFSKKSLLRAACDATNDALHTLMIKYNVADDGDALRYWQRIMAGDADWLRMKGLGEGQIAQVQDMVKFFKDKNLENMLEVAGDGTITFSEDIVGKKEFKDAVAEISEGAKNLDLDTAEGKEAWRKIIDTAMKRDPAYMRSIVSGLYTSFARKALNITGPRVGSLTFYLSNMGQLLRESWLAGSVRFNLANGTSNFLNALAEGHVVSPFDLGAAEHIFKQYEEFAQMGFPNEVCRSIWVDMLEGMERGHLSIQELPIPGIGTPSLARKTLLPGGPAPKFKMFEAYGKEGATALQRTLDKMNLGTLLKKSMDWSSGIESTARAQVFWKSFLEDFQGRFMSELLSDLKNMPECPEAVRAAIKSGRIRNPKDVDELRRLMLPERGTSSQQLSLLAPEGIDTTNDRVYELMRQIEQIQEDFVGYYDNPDFMSKITEAFDDMQRRMTIQYDRLMEDLSSKVTDLEGYQKRMNRALGVVPHVDPVTEPWLVRAEYWAAHPDAVPQRLRAAPTRFESTLGEVGGAERATAPVREAPPAYRSQYAAAIPSGQVEVITPLGSGQVRVEQENIAEALSQWPENAPKAGALDEISDPTTAHDYLLQVYKQEGSPGDYTHWLKEKYTAARPGQLPSSGRAAGGGFDEGALDQMAMDLVADMASRGNMDTQPMWELRGSWDSKSRQWVVGRVQHPHAQGTGGVVDFIQTGVNEIEIRGISSNADINDAIADLRRIGVPDDIRITVNGERKPFKVWSPEGELNASTIAQDAAARGDVPNISGSIKTPGGVTITAGRLPTELLEPFQEGATAVPVWMLSGQWELPPQLRPSLNNTVRGILYKTPEGQLKWTFNIDGFAHNDVQRAVGATAPLGFFTNDGKSILIETRKAVGDSATFATLVSTGFDPRTTFRLESQAVVRKVTTISETLDDWMDGSEFLDHLRGPAAAAREEAIAARAEGVADRARAKALGVHVAPASGKPTAWRNIRDEIHAGNSVDVVLDLQTGDLGWASQAEARYKAGSYNDISQVSFGATTNDPSRYLAMEVKPDGRVMMSAGTFEETRNAARMLTESHGFTNKTVVVAQMKPGEWDPAGGPFVGYVRELLTGELDPMAPTQAELFFWEAAQSQQFANLRLETQNAYNKLMGETDQWRKDTRAAYDAGISQITLDTAERQAADGFFNSLKTKVANGVESSTYIAAQKTHQIFFDYGSRGQWEEMLRYVSPFTTWQIRNPMFWAQVFAQKPTIMMEIYKMWRALEIQRKRMNLSDRFKNTLGVKLPGGGYAAVDVRLAIPVLGQINEPFEPIGYEGPEDGWQRVMKWMLDAGQTIGLRPWPWLEYGLQKMGVVPERDIVRGLFGPFQRLAETIMMLSGARKPWESLFGTVDPQMQAQYEYYINREINIMEAEGLLTHEQVNEALDNPGNLDYQQAAKRAIGVQAALSFLSLISPTAIKFAEAGEVQIREGLAEKAALPQIEQSRFAMENPELQTYARIQSTKTERQRSLEQERLYGELRITEDETRREEIFTRLEGLTTHHYEYGSPRFVMAMSFQKPAKDEQETYFRLNSLQPRASDFEDKDGEIDWEAYDRAMEHFNRLVPLLSEEWQQPMSLDRFMQWESRTDDPVTVAFELNRERRNEGWRQLALYQPGGKMFGQAMSNYVTSQYQADLVSGMDPEIARARYLDTWKYVSANGLPADYENELVKQYADNIPAEQLAPQVAHRLGMEWDALEERQQIGIQGELRREAGELPGMYTASRPEAVLRQNITNYYYNLMPDEKRQVVETLEMPEGVTLSEYLKQQSPEDLQRMWNTVRNRSQIGEMYVRLGGAISMGLMEQMLPPMDQLTADEHADLLQVERDWFAYSYTRDTKRKGGTWTPLMEKYYGGADTPSGEFWSTLNRYALDQSAFDDPVMGAFLNSVSRGGLDFSDEQYKWATEYFTEHLDTFIDPVLTAQMYKHPDWVAASGEARTILDSHKDLDMEKRKQEYYTLPYARPSKGVPSPREEWERDNPLEYDQILRYLNESKARRLAYPEYLYFMYPAEYKKWFNGYEPDDMHDSAKRLSTLYLQALTDLDKYEASTGPWTYAMEVFIGPDPGAVKPARTVGGRSYSGPPPPPPPPLPPP